MSSEDPAIYWILEIAVPPGQLDALKGVAADRSAATKASEPGTLGYHWSAAPDGLSLHIFEHYKDSASALVHLNKVGRENFAAVKPLRFSVYGAPSPELKDFIAPTVPVYYQSIGGFLR